MYLELKNSSNSSFLLILHSPASSLTNRFSGLKLMHTLTFDGSLRANQHPTVGARHLPERSCLVSSTAEGRAQIKK